MAHVEKTRSKEEEYLFDWNLIGEAQIARP